MPTDNSTCEICNTRFHTSASKKAKGWGRYCSRKCKGIAHQQQTLNASIENGLAHTCETCGKVFHVKPSASAKGTGVFCSQGCKSEGQHARSLNQAKVLDRFWAKVQKTDTCWLWTDKPGENGYGTFYFGGKTLLAHRFSYEVQHGKHSAKEFFVLHKCDNRRCVNPDHLFLGTHQDNMDDMANKGRKRAVGRGKVLDVQSVIELRKLYASGNYTYKQLSAVFGVKPKAAERAIKGITWALV